VKTTEAFASADELAAILDRFSKQRVAVVGDFFLDQYLVIDAALEEPSLETGLPAHQVVEIRNSPGAAGTVVNNLVALEAGMVAAFGAIGDDGPGYDLMRALLDLDVDVAGLIADQELMTPTYMKPVRFDAGVESELSRMDVLNRRPTGLGLKVAEKLAERLREFDAVIVVDQVADDRGGVVDAAFRRRLAELGTAHPDVFILADSRFSMGDFRNVRLKPNVHEAKRSLGENIDDPVAFAKAASDRCSRDVFLTLSAEGMIVASPNSNVERVEGIAVPEPIDPTGAGDSASAAIALASASGATNLQAAAVGNIVASITVQQLRTTGTASRQRVLKRFQRAAEGRPIDD
jgi:rfaE bifunctional protein kinase chain/domain